MQTALAALLCATVGAGAGWSGALLHELPMPSAITADMAVAGAELTPAGSGKIGLTHGEYRRSPDGLFRILALVNGKPIEFILDSGATTVFLTAADADRAGLTAKGMGATDTMETASGPSPMRWAKLDRISIAGKSLGHVDAAVVSDGLKTSLLGQNVLSKIGTITQRGNRLMID